MLQYCTQKQMSFIPLGFLTSVCMDVRTEKSCPNRFSEMCEPISAKIWQLLVPVEISVRVHIRKKTANISRSYNVSKE